MRSNVDVSRKLIVITVGVAIIAGCVLFFNSRNSRNVVPSDAEIQFEVSSETDATYAGTAPDPRGKLGQTNGHQKLSIAHPFPAIPQSRAGLSLEGDPFRAESKAEQAWLDRNGYPNAEQWEAYSQTTDGLLADAAATGDTVAKVMLDNRRLIYGDKTAFKDLLSAGTDGSTFALEMLSAFMAGSSEGDPIMGYALSRVVEMRGNYRVAIARDALFNERLNPVQRMEAERKAMVIFNGINESNKRLKKGGATVDPRPTGG